MSGKQSKTLYVKKRASKEYAKILDKQELKAGTLSAYNLSMAIENSILLLLDQPLSAKKEKGYHVKAIPKFPYKIYYKVRGSRLTVHRVIHDRQSADL